jgi:preprotein translocase subunit SecG
MLTVIIVIHLMLVLAMIGVVLLQKSEGGGLVGGSSGGFLTSRGTANVLSRTTALLAIGFFLTSLALSWLAGFQRHPAAIITGGSTPTSQQAPGGAPSPPSIPNSGNLLKQLEKGIPNAPAGPGAAPNPEPSGPQVPQSH